MKVYTNKTALSRTIKALKSKNKSIGFVPTMGALHEGHISLIQQALLANHTVVVSIFVNPTQFDNPEDLEKYPKTLDADIALLEKTNASILVYAPSVKDIYPEKATADSFNFDGLEHEMEGKFRKGHFNGVATIVKRLFDIVQPNAAYFGEKDYQQLLIIKKLVEKHSIPVSITGCKIYRAPNGLALSSRNSRLTPEYREEASIIYKTLQTAKQKFGTESATKITNWVTNEFANNEKFELEYFIIANASTLKPIKRKIKNQKYRAFIAVYASNIRLIDNIALN